MISAQHSSPSEILAHLVAGSPAPAIDALAEGLETGAISLETSSVGIDSLPQISAETAKRAALAFANIKGKLDEKCMAVALRLGNELRRVERLDRPEIEIVWTGPEAEGPLVRPTAVVVEEMLREVREAGEILIVGYSLTAENGTIMKKIVDLLGEASQKRAAITIILHRDDEEKNKANLLKAWNVFAKKPKVMTWDPPPNHPYTKLHAKVMVVDRLEALVTSANLTFHGLESNLELGLRVRGPQAAAIAERFDHLMASNVLREWKD